MDEIATDLDKAAVKYKGKTEFCEKAIQEIFRDKTVHYSESIAGGIGDLQSDLNLANADWFAYNDNFGTSEEKAFVKYFSGRIDELKKIYSKIFLVRNERAFHIHAFDNGARFEPDFVLFLQKKDATAVEQFQIFIEPKGTHLTATDSWKEKFLIQLKDTAIPVKVFVDDTRYRIWGLPFYNRDDVQKFDSAFSDLVKD